MSWVECSIFTTEYRELSAYATFGDRRQTQSYFGTSGAIEDKKTWF